MMDPVDWQTGKTSLDCTKYILEKELNCDVNFKVGEYKETVKAHKFILSMRSAVFDRMFNGSFCESDKDPIVPDVSPATFKALLRYCYYECVDFIADLGLPLLYTAQKYMLPLLEDAARRAVVEHLDDSRVQEVCQYSMDVGDEGLRAGCTSYFMTNLNMSNIWDACKYASDVGDGDLYTHCKLYLVRNLNSSNVWDICKYATDVGDEELHSSCKSCLATNLSSTDIWKVCKYASDVGDEELHSSCKSCLATNLSSTDIWKVCKYASDIGDGQLQAACSQYFKRNLSASNILDVTKYAESVGDEDLYTYCNTQVKKHLSAINIWHIYTYEVNRRNEEVQDYCRQYFEGDIRTVREAFQAEAFLNIPHKVLLDLLHINDKVEKAGKLPNMTETREYYKNNLGISVSEVELFNACNAWAEAECLRQEIDPSGANKRTVLGECLFLIRFPTMLQEDLMTVVYPTNILTQPEIDKLCQFKHQDPASDCGFASGQQQFLVTPSGSTSGSNMSTVYVDSEVRVLLSRVWTLRPGSHRVSMRDEKSGRSVVHDIDTRHENQLAGYSESILYYLDVEPAQVLEAGTRYTITAERTKGSDSLLKQHGVQYVRIVGGLSPFKEVKVTPDSKTFNYIHAVTLSLV